MLVTGTIPFTSSSIADAFVEHSKCLKGMYIFYTIE